MLLVTSWVTTVSSLTPPVSPPGPLRGHHCCETHVGAVQRVQSGVEQDDERRRAKTLRPVSQGGRPRHRQPRSHDKGLQAASALLNIPDGARNACLLARLSSVGSTHSFQCI